MSKAKRILAVTLVVIIAAGCVVGGIYMKDKIDKRLYPLEYQDMIVACADEYGLDPYFVCAVIKTESGFDSGAVSRSGAQGLMQLMPETAEWIAGKLERESYDAFDPSTNIEFGCWYLAFLQQQFEDENAVIAAYNAGHNKVAEWLENGYSKDGKTLFDIPYKETEKYVEKVNKAYEKYKEIYNIG